MARTDFRKTYTARNGCASAALFTILLMSCSGGRAPAEPLFPNAAGPWKLKHASDLTPDQIPEPIRRLGVRRAGAAEYEGAGSLKVENYEMTSSAAAFEAEQTWRPAANTVAVHHDKYFTVIHWENADRAAVSAFVREMEQRLGR